VKYIRTTTQLQMHFGVILRTRGRTTIAYHIRLIKTTVEMQSTRQLDCLHVLHCFDFLWICVLQDMQLVLTDY